MSSPPNIPGKGFVNGPLYNAAHFSTAYLNVPPNLHRFRNAVGLTIGIWLGRKAMNILTGSTIDGKKVDPQDLPPPLRPLCGIIQYDHFSDDPKHRWMKVFDMTVPAILGGIGAGVGSYSFFEDKFIKEVEKKLAAKPEQFFLHDAEREALYFQSKPASLPAGEAAVFGSASGFGLIPSPLNYSSTLGALFTVRAERAMANPLLRKLFNSHSPYPWRPHKLIGEMIEYVAGNPSAHPEKLESYAHGILKSWFKGTTEEQVHAFVTLVEKERDKFIKDGRLPEEAAHIIKNNLSGAFAGSGLEKTLIDIGIDPREAAVGDMGFLSSMTHILGDAFGMKTTKHMDATRAKMIAGMEARHPELKAKPFVPGKPHYSDDLLKKVAVGSIIGTGAGTLLAISAARDTGVADLDDYGNGHIPGFNGHGHHNATAKTAIDPNCNCPIKEPDKENKKEKPAFVERVGAKKHVLHSKKHHSVINGKVLDTAEGITSMFNAGVGMHRIHCALGLVTGSWLADRVMDALTGVTFAGHPVKEDKILKPLLGLYKERPLKFNPHSDLPADKWMQVLRWGVPGIVGTIAVMQGSKMFFEKRNEKLKKARYLDEVEDQATMAQSKPWSYTSAISGLFGFPSGLPMLPLVNYSTNLGTRFSMGSGRKVALPVIGKIWSNNSTLFPFGPSGMIDLLIKEAVNNKANDPEMFETFTVGILKPWFANVTPQQVGAFVGHIHDVRDKFFQAGGVPEDMKAQLEHELKAHFKGAGLEETLVQIGLDPLNATIGSNGLSGAIANALGSAKTIEKIQAKYAAGYRERLSHEQDKEQSPRL